MRLASFNVESLFDRAIALNAESWAENKNLLEQFKEINDLFAHDVYTDADKARIIELLNGFLLNKRDDDKDALVRLRQNRGKLIQRAKNGDIKEVVANERADWIGWVELKTEPVNELATRHTAMVLRDVNADIQAVVEAENRPALRDFSSIMLKQVGGQPFPHVMLIDGNDDRGIDVGVLARQGYDLIHIHSHVDDQDAVGQVFSRDCPEYLFTTPSGKRLWVLVNHFKSKGYGNPAANDSLRLRQTTRVREIYQGLLADGEKNVAVVGDFNDSPDSAPVAPLLVDTDLKDVSTHPSFTDDGRPGTFGNGTKTQKFDYVLLSPDLFSHVTGGAVFRKGAWGGTNGDLWEHYPTLTRRVQAASDHAAIYADLDF